jgi:hypothetical protein
MRRMTRVTAKIPAQPTIGDLNLLPLDLLLLGRLSG